jgi:hypothetical protein
MLKYYLALSYFIMTFNPVSLSAFSLSEEKNLQENFIALSKEPGAVMFTPPQGWLLADPKALPSSIKIMVVGKGAHEYPPSMNLAYEKYSGTLQDYLQLISVINKKKGAEWKDLGKIRTQAGDASLSQVDSRTQWGEERQMHVIFLNQGVVYILTAAALKNEFPKFYKDFFDAFRSLKINS